MPCTAYTKPHCRRVLLSVAVSALLLLLSSTALHAAPQALLRLDPGGHTAMVNKLVVTPDGKLVTASDDKTSGIPRADARSARSSGSLGRDMG